MTPPADRSPILLTGAVTGGSPLNPRHPCFPVTPEEVAEACVEAARAGASIVHIHARDPEIGKCSHEPTLFR
jgi:uncharacterized protein (DUF849 family)